MSSNIRALLFWLIFTASAAETTTPVSDALQKEFFRQSAVFYSKQAELYASMSPLQRQIQDDLTRANQLMMTARQKMQDECAAKGMTLATNDYSPACEPKKGDKQ